MCGWLAASPSERRTIWTASAVAPALHRREPEEGARVRDRPQVPSALEPRVACARVHALERDVAPGLLVARAVDAAHAARPREGEDLEPVGEGAFEGG